MGSTTTQPQFRLTQPPSKVLHLRNLPWECTEEELIELCKPFGKIVNTKCNVGANRNQAFVEFADQNQAIQMVSYYASSPEPAQVRGKTVYIQYSNRHEIVNNKSAGDEASNVLLVTIEGVEAGDVSIDVLHLVFSAFGFVHKITTFEKSAGFQALVQFSDIQTATSARDSLDGRSIPRYLLADHVGPCHLRISFSAHKDLNVKFQSHRSRDYTNPNLPVAPSALDGTGLFVIGPDGQRKELESNVLLATFENMQYAVNVDVLHTVFSAFGSVKKISIFDKNQSTQALIQYADISTAMIAKEALEGHCIYEGGYCKLHLSYSRHTDLTIKVNNDRSRDYTIPPGGIIPGHAPLPGQATSLPPVSGTAVPAAPSAYSGQQFVLPSQTVRVTQPTGSAYQRPMPNTIYAASVAETASYGSPLQPYAGQALLPSAPYPSMSSPASAPMQVSSPYIGNIASNVPLVSGSTTSNVAFSSVPYNR